jgi:hypothetical protein
MKKSKKRSKSKAKPSHNKKIVNVRQHRILVEAKPVRDVAKHGPTGSAKANGKPAFKKMSGLDAAAKVLVEAKRPMVTQEIINAMVAKGYWTSPRGKTPHATIYSAMVREISEKGKDSRFKKVDRGMFAAAGMGV